MINTKEKDYKSMTLEQLQAEIYPQNVDLTLSEEEEFMRENVYPSLNTYENE